MAKKIAFLTVAAAVIAAASPASAATNLVKNGDFQSTTTTSANGNFQIDGTQYGTVANWSGTGGYNLLMNASNATSASGNAYGAYTSTGKEYLNSAPAATAGNKFVVLDGDKSFNTAISQTIDTNGLVNGQQYTLAFDWATSSIASRQGAISAGVVASFNGQTFSTGEVAIPSSIWSKASYSFTYNSSAGNVLSFLSNGTPTGLPPVALLDNVSLTAAVPEPATWAMMLVGFGMVGATSRYRRRKTVLAAA